MADPARCWFITGISSGLGLALAKAVLARGDRVEGTFRKPEQGAQFEQLAPGRARAYRLDVTDFPAIPIVAAQAIRDLGRVDVLVNNAGYGLIGATEEVSHEQVMHHLSTNLIGPITLIRAFAEHFRTRRSGHIINISSTGGIFGFGGLSMYNAAKFGLEGLSEGLAGELAPLGVKVTIIAPGGFRTNWSDLSMQRGVNRIPDYDKSRGQLDAFISGNAGKQVGDPDKAALAIIKVVESANPPLRLALGEDAIAAVRRKIDLITRDLEAWDEVSRSTAFASGAPA